MKKITVYRQAIEVPERAEELDDWRYEALLRLKYFRDFGRSGPGLLESLKGKPELQVMIMAVAMILCGRMPGQMSLLTPGALADVATHAAPVAEGFFDAQGHLSLGRPDNRMPRWWGRDGIYDGPGTLLEGLSYGEVATALQNVTGTLTAGALMEVARIMYRLPDSELHGQPRRLMTLAAHCAEMLLYVWGRISSAPIWIGDREIDFTILFRSAGGGADDGLGMNGITFEVARSGVFGTVADVEKTGFWEVLLYLYKCRFEYNENQRREKA